MGSAAAARPKVGERAPDFALPGPEGRQVHLSELWAAKTVVLYFYPKDETAGCTMEACAFRDAYEDFLAAGAEVVGVSRDDGASHAQFASHHRLPFLLLSDGSGAAHAAYGVGTRLGVLRDRVTFVIDRGGVIRHVFSSMVRMGAHVTEALRVVRGLQAAPAAATAGAAASAPAPGGARAGGPSPR